MKSAWLAVLGYMGVIFFLSGTSFHSQLFQQVEKNHVDKLVHIVEYSVLGFLLARALQISGMRPFGVMFFAAVLIIGVAWAASDEYHQSFVPNRDASVYDGMADTVGLSIGAWKWVRRQKKVKDQCLK